MFSHQTIVFGKCSVVITTFLELLINIIRLTLFGQNFKKKAAGNRQPLKIMK